MEMVTPGFKYGHMYWDVLLVQIHGTVVSVQVKPIWQKTIREEILKTYTGMSCWYLGSIDYFTPI